MLPINKELKPEMSTLTQTSEFVRRSLTLAVAMSAICAAGMAVAQAQTSTAPAQSQVTAPLVNFNAYATLPAASAAVSGSSSSSSSDSDTTTVASVPTDPLHLNAMQYGGRQRYGHPRYRGGNTNPDGSNKWMAYGGGGFTQPSGNTWKYFTPSWGLQAGFGRQFSHKFALPVEFDYDNFGLTKQTLDNQFALYNNQINYYCSQPANAGTCATDGVTPYTSLDGNAHVWSFSFQPTYTLLHPGGDGLGAYVLAGAGYYHKVTNFTTPTPEEYCDYYYGCEEYEANAIVDHYTSNAPGFDGGLGFTYKPSHFSGLRFYAEGRYVIILNSQRQGITVASPVNNTTLTVANEFPANSNRTTYFPVKFGVRF